MLSGFDKSFNFEMKCLKWAAVAQPTGARLREMRMVVQDNGNIKYTKSVLLKQEHSFLSLKYSPVVLMPQLKYI